MRVRRSRAFCTLLDRHRGWSEGYRVQCSFGDPETEVVLPKLTSDLGAGISALLNGEIAVVTDNDNATLGVVLAADGYPVDVIKGAAIPEIPVDEDSHVYYAGVARSEEGLVANSGRVLLVETSAADIKALKTRCMRLSTSSTPRACSTVTTSAPRH